MVRDLYAKDGAGARAVAELFGDSTLDASTGDVDRAALGAIVLKDDAKMAALEAAIHPLVERAREEFKRAREDAGDVVAAFDIPLLFEKGYESAFDAICVVSAGSEDIQRDRVLARPGMTEEKFKAIVARQTPDAEKRARATYVVETGCSMEDTRAAVRAMVDDLVAKARKSM